MKARIISLSMILCLLFPGVALANYWDGGSVTSSGSNIQGAKAAITYNSQPYVPSGSYFSTAWCAIGNSSYGAISQVGWDIDWTRSTSVRYYYGWINTDGQYYESQATTGPAIGSTHTYKVQMNPSTKLSQGYVDTAFCGSSTLNWTPDTAQYSGETNVASAQMPGKISNKELFSSVNYYNGNTSTWGQPSLNVWANQNQSGIDHSQYSTYGKFYIWDTRY